MLRLLILFDCLGPSILFCSLAVYVIYPDEWRISITSSLSGLLLTLLTQIIGWRTLRAMSPGLQRFGLLFMQAAGPVVGVVMGIILFFLLSVDHER